MSLILQLETATVSCSVALSYKGELLALKELNERNIHASHITLFIEEVMAQADKKMSDLSAVAVSKGPGSYTGLRIGVSTAKGLCYALDVPLIAVDTLQAMVFGLVASGKYQEDVLFCPMIDARRMEVYTTVYDFFGNMILPVEAKIIDESSFTEVLQSKKVVFFGDGAEKCHEILSKHPHATILADFVNSAKDLTPLAYQKFTQGDFEDVAYFEPFYLKDFLVTKPKNLL